MDTHVALLRGINVGGKHLLPMKVLAAMFADAGCRDVRTYIQSGNVVYSASAALSRRVASLMEGAIEEEFGFRPPVITRSAAEFKQVVTRNPFLRAGADPASLHVGFLGEAPSRTRIAALDPKRLAPDEFVVRGREIYFNFSRGLGKSTFTNSYFDSRLGAPCTVRNWRTVLALLEMTAD